MREIDRRDLFLMIDRNTGAVLPYSKYIVRGIQKKLSLTVNIERGVKKKVSP
jgi:hypothetical protein